MAKNSNLHKAKKEKNDEFYTQMGDIENELWHYREHFVDKVVFLNCDDPEESHFWKYFSANFEFLGLKRLISLHYDAINPTYRLDIVRDVNGDGKINRHDMEKIPLRQNGDFRSEESIELLQLADIVVTNPPFSLFREFIDLMEKYEKKYLVIGNMNAITYKEVFKLIKENKLWLGITYPKEFRQPDESIKKFGNICWFTNLPHKKRNEELVLYKRYNEADYPKYDNYDAIEVSKTKDIPMDYFRTIGVPISFLTKYCPEQFEICGTRRWFYDTNLGVTNGKTLLNGKETYDRVFIRHKQPNGSTEDFT